MENWSIFEQISENGKFTPTPSNILTVGAVQCGSLVLCVTSRWWWSSDIIWCWWLRQTLMLAPGRLSLVSWRGAPNKILIISQIFTKNVISDNCLTVRMFVWGLCRSKQDYYQYWQVLKTGVSHTVQVTRGKVRVGVLETPYRSYWSVY